MLDPLKLADEIEALAAELRPAKLEVLRRDVGAIVRGLHLKAAHAEPAGHGSRAIEIIVHYGDDLARALRALAPASGDVRKRGAAAIHCATYREIPIEEWIETPSTLDYEAWGFIKPGGYNIHVRGDLYDEFVAEFVACLADAALSALHPGDRIGGCVLVPAEPTEAMVEAAWALDSPSMPDVYRAMLAAIPEAPDAD